ncbi:MAG TPA: MlaD family protein [Acetobacteraceae bacterium]|nr:MlaD family protein [Acetobacteraceae bacterium]
MAARSAAFRTGLFVIGGIAAIIAVVFVLSGGSLHPGLRYESYFQESVQGLDVGSAVKFRGVTIGKVTDISLVSAVYPPEDRKDLRQRVYHQVVVRYRVDPRKLGPDINMPLAVKDGLRVQVASQGITGLAYLELSFIATAPPPVAVPWHPRSPVIPSVPSTLTQVQDAVQHFLVNMDKVKFDEMLKSLTSLVNTVNEEATTGDAHQALANANALLGQLRREMKAADLPATTAAVRDLADGNQTRAILARLGQASQELAQSSAAMPRLLAQTQATIARTNQIAANLNLQVIPILRNLNAATANIRELSETLKNNPAVVLRGVAPPPRTPQ